MDWKPRQSRLTLKRKQPRVRKVFVKRLMRLLAAAAVLMIVLIYGPPLVSSLLPDLKKPDPVKPEVIVDGQKEYTPPLSPPPEAMKKDDLAEIIGAKAFEADEIHSFKIVDGQGHVLYVQTTLDQALQAWAVKFLPKITARAAALVALDPRTGEVLAMTSWQADGEKVNLAVTSVFPAASLIKIVTAAAAVEDKKMTGDTKLAYDGGKWTLYRQHVAKGTKQGEHSVTLEESFASSINTVFGKIGAFTLGEEELESFAKRFHFNEDIHFEMPVENSKFVLKDEEDPYRLAELASGFNRTTKLSPLHGAMLASAVVNDGLLMEPTVVKEVFDMDNRIYYQQEPVSLGRVVSERTVKELRKLMLATISEGTGRRRFSDVRRHKILSKLEIGGKSGSIDNDEGRRVDWFVCFAQVKGRKEAIALAAVVVHGENMGTRSQEIIREAIIHYFEPRL